MTCRAAEKGQRGLRAGAAAAALAATALLSLGAGAASVAAAQTARGPAPAIVLPPAGAQFDYQLGGASPIPAGATVVERDSTDPPAGRVYGICYVNGFQTQPGVFWPRKLLVHAKSGRLLVDPNWPDEHIINVSRASTRRAAAARLGRSIERCAAAGYQAVEFDNLDSWTRSRGAFGKREAVAFATLLVTRAHAAGLAAAQKNAAELGSAGRTAVGYDFAIAEECDVYRECGAYTAVYGSLVFDVEYTDDLRGTPAEVCARAAAAQPRASVIVRDRDLVPARDPKYSYAVC